jgi:hypothetical protein
MEENKKPSPWIGRLVSFILLATVVLGTWAWTNGLTYETPIVLESEAAREALRDLRKVAPGETVSMSSGSDRLWIMETGFGLPEADGTWIESRQASLVIEPPAGASRSLTLFVYPLLGEGKTSRSIAVSSGSESVSADLTGGGQEVVVRLGGTGTQVIEISCDSLDSPAELGLGPDERSLCAKLISISLSE